MICINFNSVISATEKSEKFRFRYANPLVYQIPSQVWSVNEKMHSEVYIHVLTLCALNVTIPDDILLLLFID